MKLYVILIFLSLLATVAMSAPQDLSVSAKGAVEDWSVPVAGWTPLQPGEHPRLLFRKSDLPALKKRMETPEGKAIITRLRATLNGTDGESMPTIFNSIGSAYGGKEDLPFGAYSISHAAGY
ncbi:MAG: hypothetical protein WCJ56_07600 [bacterium]